MKCKHTSFEMTDTKLIQVEYEGEAVIKFKAICSDCGKHIKNADENKSYFY